MSASAAVVLTFVLSGDAQVFTNGSQDLRFTVNASHCNGDFRSEWRTDEGRVLAQEQLIFNGNLWTRYHLQRWSINQDVLAIRENDAIRLIILNGGKRKTASVRSAAKLLVGPQLVQYLGLQLERIRKQEAVEFNYLIPEHALTLSLRAVIDRPSQSDETIVRLEATSILMRAFVPKTLLAYDGNGLLTSMTGRLLPQIGDSTGPVALDGILRVKRVESICRQGK